MKPNEPCAPWRMWLLRPWLQFWTGLFLHLGLGFWDARVKGWENYKEAQEARCGAARAKRSSARDLRSIKISIRIIMLSLKHHAVSACRI